METITTKNNYYSLNNLPPKTPNVSGEKVIPMYGVKLMKDGHKELVQKGTVDIYAKIQSHKDSQDINFILDRAKNNIVNFTNYSEEFYDLSKMPTTLVEANSIIETAKDSFNKLPVEIKNYYNNNPVAMLSDYDQGKTPDIIRQLFEPKPIVNQNLQQQNNNENQNSTNNQ